MLESWLLAALVAAPAPAAPAQAADGAAPETLLIRTQRLIVRPGEERRDVAILVQRGRIVAIGEGLAAPEGARELEGAVVCAGLFDPWSSIGLERESVADPRTGAATRSADALDPWSSAHERVEALRGGVTAARVQAGLAAPLGGIGAVVRTSSGPDGEPLVLADACVAATVGLSRDGSTMDVFDRVDEVEKLHGLLDRARQYRKSREDYERELALWEKTIAEKTVELEKDFKKAQKKRAKEMEEAEEKGKEFKEERYKEDKKPREPKHDADAEVLARVVDGELPLVVEAHRAAEIRSLLRVTADFSALRLVLVGCCEAEPYAAELAEREIPVVLWPTPMGEERLDEWSEHDLALAGRLAEAGVRVLIGSGGARNPRDLRLFAALAAGHGLDRDAALDAITRAPAEVFDLGERLGSVEQGREAELLVLDGDPLESTTNVRYVISGGRVWTE